MIVYVNPFAQGGRAGAIWSRLRGPVRERFGAFLEVEMPDDEHLWKSVRDAVVAGERDFAAAGGDGTVNRLLNALIAAHPSTGATPPRLGAIALGSSNDFHKPRRKERIVDGVSCRLDFEDAAAADVGRLMYETPNGNLAQRYWILNASVGITADANEMFNTHDSRIERLKTLSTGLAILNAALRTIARHRARRLVVRTDTRVLWEGPTSNVAVLKSPHCSGCLCYDVPFDPQGGRFFVCVFRELHRLEAVGLLVRLALRSVTSSPSLTITATAHLVVEAAEPFAVEVDGEIVHARHVTFDTRPDLLEVCP